MTPSTRGCWWAFSLERFLRSLRGVSFRPTRRSGHRSWRVAGRASVPGSYCPAGRIMNGWKKPAPRVRSPRASRSTRSTPAVPLGAFLYRRVVESVWTRHRQECSFGCRCQPGASLPDLAAPGAECPDGELLERLEAILQTLDKGKLRLIRQIFWDGRSEDDLARELGLTRQAVNKRKQKLLRRLGIRPDARGRRLSPMDRGIASAMLPPRQRSSHAQPMRSRQCELPSNHPPRSWGRPTTSSPSAIRCGVPRGRPEAPSLLPVHGFSLRSAGVIRDAFLSHVHGKICRNQGRTREILQR
jgi:hypothetical protein